MKKILMAVMFLFVAQTSLEARCDTYAIVQGLDYYGDNFLAVRTGPGSHYRKIDELYNRDVVRVCEWRGKWLYVKYSGGRYGWVYRRYLRIR